jgi:hypothetical protein
MSETDKKNWVNPPRKLIETDLSLQFLVDKRNEAMNVILDSRKTIEESNAAIAERMGTIDPSLIIPPSENLTPHQDKALRWICRYYDTYGYAPSNAELCNGIELPSQNSGVVVIKALVAKGYLSKEPNKWRGITPMFDSKKNKIQ